jgi:hypothetical protein
MTFTVRLEQADGTPAEPPSIESAVTNWRTGDTIPIAAGRSLRVVGIVGHRAAWTLKKQRSSTRTTHPPAQPRWA